MNFNLGSLLVIVAHYCYGYEKSFFFSQPLG
ncbi:hypothetical protein C8R30_101109 [Nitrosomonas nitrosa]|uniref:Uncharacterized protein n=1 Tax=Nitrosomonas nitrosa TaxID=52442 RepID=A0A1I4LJN6_9PROT|nr:hypothetical protein C8R30_101109 [Nitrosomonas nitrosa]SFL91066.1 hypothetical protein SAMN05421880_102100 [Nitrosomonas nitrosa]